MAPIKFEEHIKEKLAGREIKPSEAAWEKLSVQLKEQKHKKSNFKWWIPSVAAVVVLVVCGILFLDFNKNESIQIGETPAELKDSYEPEINHEIRIVENKPDIKKAEDIQKDDTVKPLQPTFAPIDRTPQVAIESQEKVTPATVQLTDTLSLMKEVEALLAEVADKNNKRVTDTEINALLANVAREISQKRSLNNTGNITASGLLAEVEYEVDQSFRKEVFDFLKAEFKKARTAVATRND
jgi:hypothetical protein